MSTDNKCLQYSFHWIGYICCTSVAKQKPIGWEFENGMSECCPIMQSHNSNDPEHMIGCYQWLLSAFIHGLNARCQWRLLTSHQKLRPAATSAIFCTFHTSAITWKAMHLHCAWTGKPTGWSLLRRPLACRRPEHILPSLQRMRRIVVLIFCKEIYVDCR